MDDSASVIIIGVIYLVVIVVAIIANWKIWSKAGYAGAWSLLMIVPLVGIIAYLYLAFADWPVQQRLRALEGAPKKFE